MIDRANANDPHLPRVPSTPDSVPHVRPWNMSDRPVERAVEREGQPRVTRATAHMHEGMQALPWPSSDEAAHRETRHASPALRERLAGLRAAVEGYVAQRRSEGAPVERVLAEVKALVRRAEGCDLSRETTDTLMPEVVRWGIHAFYDGDAELVGARHDP